MKYMTFRNACAFTGLANLLEDMGINAKDREIVLGAGLPWLLRYDAEKNAYLAGTMLQSKADFDRFLMPRGLQWIETEVDSAALPRALRENGPCMLGIRMWGGQKHAVVFRSVKDGIYRFLNNRYQDEPEPEFLELSEAQLLARGDDCVVLGQLAESGCADTGAGEVADSLLVLARYHAELASYCTRPHSVLELRENMDRLFSALLLELPTMLELIGQEPLQASLTEIRNGLMQAVRSEGTVLLSDFFSMEALDAALRDYAALLRARIADGQKAEDPC